MKTTVSMAGRPTGISSRLRRAKGRRKRWLAPNGQVVDLPVVVDHVTLDERTGETTCVVEAHVDLVGGAPELVEVTVRSTRRLDAGFLQRFFRWATPLDIVRCAVPQLLADGEDPCMHDFATDGYPDAADLRRNPLKPLSVEFLAQVAREYLDIGRGYAAVIAARRGVSPRTVVSWIEKARRKGILSEVRPGQFGGRIIPPEQR